MRPHTGMMLKIALAVAGLAAAALSAGLFRGPAMTAVAAPARGDATGQGDGHRIIVFGAHPDDCEIKVGGTGALWAAAGHKVKFVAATNGDIGHWKEAGGPLARRRTEEARRADAILGVTSEVLDIHDGEIMPTLENRRTFTRLVRQWGADVVISHRTNDYHPDHRYTGVLVQDSAYMVTVPFFCPDVPPLKHNPVFLYMSDGFQRPNPFRADIVVSIDAVIEKKLDATDAMESQFYEGGCGGYEGLVPADPQGQAARRKQVREWARRRAEDTANACREKLIELYGPEDGKRVRHAEAFELCEYGRRPSVEELRKIFPIGR